MASLPHQWGGLVTACLALFLVGVNTTAINTAVSAIADDLTISSSTLAWAINAYLLAVAAFVVVGGQLGDVLGRQRIFIVGMVLYALAAIEWSPDARVQLLPGPLPSVGLPGVFASFGRRGPLPSTIAAVLDGDPGRRITRMELTIRTRLSRIRWHS